MLITAVPEAKFHVKCYPTPPKIIKGLRSSASTHKTGICSIIA